eukprot:2989505-Lingulodinium_polyedra.AAC.1
MDSCQRSRTRSAMARTKGRTPTPGTDGKWCSCPSSTAPAWRGSGLMTFFDGWEPLKPCTPASLSKSTPPWLGQ